MILLEQTEIFKKILELIKKGLSEVEVRDRLINIGYDFKTANNLIDHALQMQENKKKLSLIKILNEAESIKSFKPAAPYKPKQPAKPAKQSILKTRMLSPKGKQVVVKDPIEKSKQGYSYIGNKQTPSTRSSRKAFNGDRNPRRAKNSIKSISYGKTIQEMKLLSILESTLSNYA